MKDFTKTLLKLKSKKFITELSNIKTLQLILIKLDIKINDIQDIKENEPALYNALKSILSLKIATLIELSINMPRQLQSMLILIKHQEEYYTNLFPEEQANTIQMPKIVIKPTHESATTKIDIKQIQQTNNTTPDTQHTPDTKNFDILKNEELRG